MIKQYFKYAFRNLFKDLNISLINIVGLSLGLACVIIIFIWVKSELSYENCYKKSDQIYQAYLLGIQGDNINYQATTAPPIAGILKNEFPEIEEATRISRVQEVVLKSGNKMLLEDLGGAADPNYFSIFDYHFIYGDPQNALTEPNSIVLTKSLADKFFTDNPLGKVLTLDNEYKLSITGVIKDLPPNAYRQFTFAIPFEFLKNYGLDTEGDIFFPCSYLTYALVKDDTDIAALNNKVKERINAENEFIRFEIELQAIKDTYLIETNGKSRVIIFSAIAFLIFLIACINYMNLSIGQLLTRISEIRIRRLNGAFKAQLFTQYMVEGCFAIILATILALTISWGFLGKFNELLNLQLNISFFDKFFLLGLIVIVISGCLLIGFYPSVVLSSVSAIDHSKNNLPGKVNKSKFRRSLVVFQFVITIVFIVSAIVFTRQNKMLETYNYGYNKDNILYVGLEEGLKAKIDVLKRELLQNENIFHVTTSSHLPFNIRSGSFWDWGFSEVKSRWISEIYVDEDYTRAFGFEMSEGSFYTGNVSSEGQNSIVVNKAVIDLLDETNVIGRPFTFQNRQYNLIGVVKNFQNTTPLRGTSTPMVFRFDKENTNYLFVKINPELKDITSLGETVAFIKKTCDSYSPNRPLRYQYLSDFSHFSETRLKANSQLISVSMAMAIIISCLGLLGLVFISINQKVKEIGIRKVNGARLTELLAMLNMDFLKWVFLAFILACPIAWFGMKKWLESFANKTDLSWWIFGLAGFITLIIALMTVSWQSWRVARRNPVEALRYE